MKHLPIENLRAFVTVVELGGFTQAGEVLGRSQPAISLQIKKLEELLNAQLLDRQAQKQLLTESGVQVLQYARDILALNDEIIGRFNSSELRGKIRLGIPSEFASRILPKVLGHFSKTHANVALEITSSLSRTLLSPTQQEKYDLILALENEPAPEHRLIKQDELVWVSAPKYRLPDDEIPLVVAPEGCIYRDRACQRLQQLSRKYRICFTNADMSGLITALQEGLGLTVLTRSTVPDELVILDAAKMGLPELGQVSITLLLQGRSNARVVKALAEDIVKAF